MRDALQAAFPHLKQSGWADFSGYNSHSECSWHLIDPAPSSKVRTDIFRS
jgi:hypothetical protein